MLNNLDSVIGHRKQKDILKRQLDQDQISHAYMFYGQNGIGKRTLAEELALDIVKKGLINQNRNITLEHADIFRIGLKDENIKIKEIRDLIAETVNRPLEGSNRVFIIDHADKMNTVAQNALLKTIEEPNPGNTFILITDNPSAILPTIKSRCQEMNFFDLSKEEKKELLKEKSLNSDNVDFSLSPGKIIESLEDPKYFAQLDDYYKRFISIVNGNNFELFALSDELSKDKLTSTETLELFIRRLSKNSIKNNKPNERILKILNILFDLLEIFTYNVNYKLQWENAFIRIITET